MEKLLTVMNFSHVYEKERFFLDEEYNWVDCSKVRGTNGYCDKNAFHILQEKVKSLKPEGIHFIDSGNYHYASELWIDKIKNDFTLIVFDHHSDMRRPSFGDILSCGSWIMDEIDNNKYIKKVIIIGLSEEQKETIPRQYLNKVVGISDTDLMSLNKNALYKLINSRYPVYISIDKDVLSEDIVNTSWDQGDMNFDFLKRILHSIILKYDIIGVDVCGDTDPNNIENIRSNDKVNERLLKFLLDEDYNE
ncbi:arginase family protein [Clostridium sp.]|uniref:arginase family protein n=1 Tax=Clostridium sp. TaxID=1506 RepID=UPI001D7008EB|nr:arginase family protein [Clostridium sp.]MBS5939073.1 arginase family protein [Clostridium sp.]